ncbi:MAG: hypothetical protein F6K40_09625 [Okeania sp. SIO3I5]|nr:hypothetical protein [Okeania sp. SIO3I5]NEQ36522.1 hypothetical protein [Okeania sp. SIO3I5]
MSTISWFVGLGDRSQSRLGFVTQPNTILVCQQYLGLLGWAIALKVG